MAKSIEQVYAEALRAHGVGVACTCGTGPIADVARCIDCRGRDAFKNAVQVLVLELDEARDRSAELEGELRECRVEREKHRARVVGDALLDAMNNVQRGDSTPAAVQIVGFLAGTAVLPPQEFQRLEDLAGASPRFGAS